MYRALYTRNPPDKGYDPFDYGDIPDDVICIISDIGCGCCSSEEWVTDKKRIQEYIDEMEKEIKKLKALL